MFQWILNVHLGWEWRIFNHLFSIGIIHLGSTQNLSKKNNISYPAIRTRVCAHEGARNVSFSENFAYVLNE